MTALEHLYYVAIFFGSLSASFFILDSGGGFGMVALRNPNKSSERVPLLLYLLINILRSISRHQIYLFGSVTVMAQSGIVLKAIARAILVHWLMGNKLRGVWGAYSVCNLHASGQRLPRVISCLPPASTLQQNISCAYMTISVGNQITTNQSELTTKPRNPRKARENSETRFLIGFDFASDWLRNQHVCS